MLILTNLSLLCLLGKNVSYPLFVFYKDRTFFGLIIEFLKNMKWVYFTFHLLPLDLADFYFLLGVSENKVPFLFMSNAIAVII